ncbi:MAG: hypothetical protein LBR76_02300, partial [Oscillospiraceae bacterium]|nr:hypothetical protein [Oscillospiraceae bacterium]
LFFAKYFIFQSTGCPVFAMLTLALSLCFWGKSNFFRWERVSNSFMQILAALSECNHTDLPAILQDFYQCIDKCADNRLRCG